MRKNGFTLIELLAVIVILAIIALIATPIILGIINDAREKANERSVELYASAVRNALAAYQLTGTNAPKSFSDLTIQYDGDVKCTVQELYEDGSFYLEGCKVNNEDKEYSYGTKQGTTIEVGKMSICNPLSDVTEGTYTAGDKYECDVDPNKEGYDYTFYVLNADATSVNLIMDSNITSTGEAIKDANPSDNRLVAWTSNDYLDEHAPLEDLDNFENLNIYGPITVMEYLAEATKDWKNVNPQTISTFTDDAGETHNMAQTFNVNARLPYISEVGETGCDITTFIEGTCPFWMVDHLENEYYQYENRTGVSGVFAYWTLSSSSADSDSKGAWYVLHLGYASYGRVNDDESIGVRPVITLSI